MGGQESHRFPEPKNIFGDTSCNAGPSPPYRTCSGSIPQSLNETESELLNPSSIRHWSETAQSATSRSGKCPEPSKSALPPDMTRKKALPSSLERFNLERIKARRAGLRIMVTYFSRIYNWKLGLMLLCWSLLLPPSGQSCHEDPELDDDSDIAQHQGGLSILFSIPVLRIVLYVSKHLMP